MLETLFSREFAGKCFFTKKQGNKYCLYYNIYHEFLKISRLFLTLKNLFQNRRSILT